MPPPVFEKVSEGQRLVIDVPSGNETVAWETEVQPSHESAPGSGQWYCAIHRQVFSANIGMQAHNDEPGSHVWAWICLEHGPEVP